MRRYTPLSRARSEMNEHLSRSEVEHLLSVTVLAKLIPCNIATSMVETQGLLEKRSCDGSYAIHRGAYLHQDISRHH
jgi:hypothetical protein